MSVKRDDLLAELSKLNLQEDILTDLIEEIEIKRNKVRRELDKLNKEESF